MTHRSLYHPLPLVLASLLIPALGASAAYADNASAAPFAEPSAPLANPPAAPSSSDEGIPDDSIYGLLGLDFGYSALGAGTTVETSKDGIALDVKVVGSKYWHEWIGDLGLGYFHDQTSASSNIASVKVTTNGGFVEGGARYRLTRTISVGPVVNVLFGPDVGFNEDPNVKSSAALLAGARFQYDIPMDDNLLRVGAHVVTDLTIANRQVTWVQADVQFGLPFSKPAKVAEVPPSAPIAAEPVPAVEPPAAPAANEEKPFPAVVTPSREVDVTLNDVFFHFDTDSSKLKPSAKRKLKKLATFLLKNQDIWKKMRIEGHTDIRGSAKHNTVLSEARANSVKRELVNGGLPTRRIRTRGYGPTRPVDPAHTHAAYAKNRRVEVILDGVKDPEALANEINSLSGR